MGSLSPLADQLKAKIATIKKVFGDNSNQPILPSQIISQQIPPSQNLIKPIQNE